MTSPDKDERKQKPSILTRVYPSSGANTSYPDTLKVANKKILPLPGSNQAGGQKLLPLPGYPDTKEKTKNFALLPHIENLYKGVGGK